MGDEAGALRQWIESTRTQLHTLCKQLHLDPEELKEWQPPTDRCLCAVCSLEVPTKTYQKHLTNCQIKKLLPFPKELKVLPSSAPFYTAAPLVVSFRRTDKPLDLPQAKKDEQQSVQSMNADQDAPHYNQLLTIPKFSEMDDVEVVEPRESLPSIVDPAPFLPDNAFKAKLESWSKIPSLFVSLTFDQLPDEAVRSWSMEALEWLMTTIKSENHPDLLSKKLYDPFGNYAPYFVLELWKFLILQILETQPQIFYQFVQYRVQQQQQLKQLEQQTQLERDDGLWKPIEGPVPEEVEIDVHFVKEYLAQKQVPIDGQNEHHRQLHALSQKERAKREKIVDVSMVPDLTITVDRQKQELERLTQERDNKRRRHRYKEAKKSSKDVMREAVLLLMNDMYQHLQILRDQEEQEVRKSGRERRERDERDDRKRHHDREDRGHHRNHREDREDRSRDYRSIRGDYDRDHRGDREDHRDARESERKEHRRNREYDDRERDRDRSTEGDGQYREHNRDRAHRRDSGRHSDRGDREDRQRPSHRDRDHDREDSREDRKREREEGEVVENEDRYSKRARH